VTESTRLRAIFFDLDETLVLEEASVHGALDAACQIEAAQINSRELREAILKHGRELWRAGPEIEYGRRLGISSWEGLHGDFSGDGPNLKRLREWAGSFGRNAWSAALADFGVRDADLAARLDCRFRIERSKRHIAYPDAAATLRQLRTRFKLGLVTNGAPRIQRDKVEGAGLSGYFDSIVASGDVGVGKPDPAIFRHALELLGVRPQEAAMIGDTVERDIAGVVAKGDEPNAFLRIS